MAALVIYRDVPAQAVIDYGAGARDVAVQNIDGEAVDSEPAAAVYPRPPRARLRRRVSASRVVELRGAASQLFRVELARVLIYPDVDIGVRSRASNGARAAEHDRLHAAHARERARSPFYNIIR